MPGIPEAEAKKDLGNKAFAAKDYDEAIKYYTAAISIDSKNCVYYSNRSACHGGKGDWEKAANDAKECIKATIASQCSIRTNQFDAALATVKQGMAVDSNNSQLQKQMRQIKAKRDNQRRVQNATKTATSAATDNAPIRSLDPSVIKEVQDLQAQYRTTAKEFRDVQGKIRRAQLAKRTSELTKNQLEELPDGSYSKLYRPVGKMFMLASESEITTHLDETIEKEGKNETSLSSKMEYLEKMMKSQQQNIQELTKSASDLLTTHQKKTCPAMIQISYRVKTSRHYTVNHTDVRRSSISMAERAAQSCNAFVAPGNARADVRLDAKLEGRDIDGVLTPTNNFVLIKVADIQEETEGGILLTGSAKIKKTEGSVVSVGPGKTHQESGLLFPMPVVAGEGVVYGKYDGTEIDYESGKHTLIQDTDILVKFTGDELTLESADVCSDNVLVKVDASEEETASGLVIAATAKKGSKPSTGQVVKVGPGRMASNGEIMTVDIAVDDYVKFRDFAGNEVQISGEEYAVVRMTDILAKF
ncbi:chaperonin CPN20 [Skeletonema marinoi]|uniref:20 kDa chaperonin, chloroplastic n=1 Tax=Skeletonema marinoi TaxID=267567 RepID=A0AAD8Y602_9STRA|nr:chaperonin CPN20 [Skeletonema marinoi]